MLQLTPCTVKAQVKLKKMKEKVEIRLFHLTKTEKKLKCKRRQKKKARTRDYIKPHKQCEIMKSNETVDFNAPVGLVTAN